MMLDPYAELRKELVLALLNQGVPIQHIPEKVTLLQGCVLEGSRSSLCSTADTALASISDPSAPDVDSPHSRSAT